MGAYNGGRITENGIRKDVIYALIICIPWQMNKWTDLEDTRREYMYAGDRLYFNGDIELEDYDVRVSTYGTVVQTPQVYDDTVLVCLDEVDGDKNVNCIVGIDQCVICSRDWVMAICDTVEDTLFEDSETGLDGELFDRLAGNLVEILNGLVEKVKETPDAKYDFYRY